MNFGIIGLGVMGSNHKRVYESTGNYVTDIFDPFLYKNQTIKNFINSCKKNNVKGISICNPSCLHVETSLKILTEYPECFLLVEKPISINSKDSLKLKKFNHKILVGHIERFNPAIINLLELIRSDFFGEIYCISTKRVNNVPSREPIKDVSTDLLVHDIEILNEIFGDNLSFKKILKKSSNNNSVIDYAHAFLEFGSTIAYCEAHWLSPIKERSLSFYCSKGFVHLDYYKQIIYSINKQGIKEEIFSCKPQEEPLVNEIQHFKNVILGKENPRVTVDSANKVMEVFCENF
jgi:UDP-N-acetylglucosamine 3-dehydrogenase